MSADLLDQYGVAAHARLRGDKIALASAEGTVTYAELDRSISEAARALRELGVGPDRRLGIALRNRPEWMIAALAAARIGAESVPIPAGATSEEREYYCADGEVAYLLDEESLDDFADVAAKQSTEPLEDALPDYAILRAYTSGTTGHPKAVLRPPADAAPAIEGLIRYYGAYGIGGVDEINITASPVHHLAGFSGPHSALLLGHTTFILDHFDAREWLETVDRERVTYTWCAPVHLYRLMQVPAEERATYDVSSIKRVLHGSAPCAPTLKREVMAYFPEGAVWETYGGTETMGTVISAEEWLAKPGSVGRAAPGSTIKIYDDDGAELPPGDVGLVYIGSDWGRGFRYAGPEELTTAVYRGNLATLGDLGYLDEDGYLFIVDRRKDMVITGGANVYPAEVEAVLIDHPGIAEVAVLGMPDDEYGERVTAVVVAGGPVTADEVMAFAREHLVAYKSPRRVEFVESLPRDPMGKVRKRQLRDQLA